MSESEKKAVPVLPGENTRKIPVNENSLASMLYKGREHLQSVVESTGHDQIYMRAVKTGREADDVLAAAAATSQPSAPVRAQVAPKKKVIFAVGDTVFDVEHARKTTIVKLNVGYTAKQTPIHRVIDKAGNKWLQKETKLKQL